MKWIVCFVGIAMAACSQQPNYLSPNAIQLSTPVVKSKSVFIGKDNWLVTPKDSNTIGFELSHRETGTTSTHQPNDSIQLTKTGSYALRAVAAPFLPSEIVAFEILEPGQAVASIEWKSTPVPQYFKNGSRVLMDGKSAENTFQASGWVGSKHPFEFSLVFNQSIAVDSIKISVLCQPSNWILPNATLQLSWKNNEQEAVKKEFILNQKTNNTTHSRYYLSFPIDDETDKIALAFTPHDLPQAHPGAGTPAWIFMDELIVY